MSTPLARLPDPHRVVVWVLALNLVYFLVEFATASVLHSVALFADSIDFLEDSALNLLILLGLSWSLGRRIRLSRILSVLMLIPVASAGWMVVYKVQSPVVPEAGAMVWVGLGALAVNLTCAIMMSRYRDTRSGVLLAAFYSARNDALANLGIILAGLITLWVVSPLPDLIVGLAIMALNIDASRRIWRAGSAEAAEPEA